MRASRKVLDQPSAPAVQAFDVLSPKSSAILRLILRSCVCLMPGTIAATSQLAWPHLDNRNECAILIQGDEGSA
jgi:hypothetical protein